MASDSSAQRGKAGDSGDEARMASAGRVARACVRAREQSCARGWSGARALRRKRAAPAARSRPRRTDRG
jgi:hypothetical protein